jgi:hypothetical protein
MPDNNKQTSFSEDRLRKAISQLYSIQQKIRVVEEAAEDRKLLEDIWFDLLFLIDDVESILEEREPTPRLDSDSREGIGACTESPR